MRAIVTGAAGFIGGHLCEHLREQGWEVVGVDRRGSDLICDVRDLQAYQEYLPGHFDAIFHLAGRGGVTQSLQDPVGYVDDNVGGTAAMLEFARQRGVRRFVFSSSSSVYGNAGSGPLNPYAATKVAAEAMGKMYYRHYGISFCALRLFTVYGPRQRPDMALPIFAKAIMEGQTIYLRGRGRLHRDCTYVGDAVRALELAGSRDVARPIDIGTGVSIPLPTMVAALEKALGRKAVIEYEEEWDGEATITRADTGPAARLLGFTAEVAFRDGVVRSWGPDGER